MIEIGNKVYRNLQEQVYENVNQIVEAKDDIDNLESAVSTLQTDVAGKLDNVLTQPGDLVTLNSLGQVDKIVQNGSVNKKYLTETYGVASWADVNGTDVKSSGVTAGKVLMADGSGAASWDNVDVYGEDVLSTGASAGQVLMADGDDGADWLDINGSDIKSIGMTSGKVLTADGSGGAGWQDVPQNFTGSTTSVSAVISVGTNQLSSSTGSNGDVMKWNGGPIFGKVTNSNIDSTGATSGQALVADGSGNVSWQTPSGGMANPMTTEGDIITGDAGGSPKRLAKANTTYKKFLASSSGINPQWDNVGIGTFYVSGGNIYKTTYVSSNSAGAGGMSYGKPGNEFGLGYVTSAPTAANTDGLKIAVLSSDPGTKYSGWLYIITS